MINIAFETRICLFILTLYKHYYDKKLRCDTQSLYIYNTEMHKYSYIYFNKPFFLYSSISANIQTTKQKNILLKPELHLQQKYKHTSFKHSVISLTLFWQQSKWHITHTG